ncbi:MAG: spore cortex biosynthesis protein YabQ [Ruminococcus sp.]|nr:spore cortex biosynthesis protein YabQ [Ruminococcus sp.]
MNVPETFFTVHEQLILLGLSCLFGAVLGVCYDFFRAARVIFPHNSWLVIIEDILFMCGYAVFLTSFSSAAARGEFRFYFVIGNAIGFILYFFTVGSVMIKALKKLYGVLGGIVRIIMRPLKGIYVLICEKAALKFVGSSKNDVKRFKNPKTLLKMVCELLYNRMENKKRKNVKNVAEKSKTSEQKERAL